MGDTKNFLVVRLIIGTGWSENGWALCACAVGKGCVQGTAQKYYFTDMLSLPLSHLMFHTLKENKSKDREFDVPEH